MSLKCSLNSRFSAFTENANLKNIATANRTYSFWVYIPGKVAGMWSMGYLGWFENNFPFVAGGALAGGNVAFQKSNVDMVFCRAWSSAGGLTGNGGDGSSTPGWKHVVVTVTNSTTVNMYVNNVQIITNCTVPTTHLFAIGWPMKHIANKTDGVRYRGAADCLLADLCVFNGVISAGERTTLYAGGAPTYARDTSSPIATGLLLRCPFEDHMKDVISDTHIFGSQFAAQHVADSPFPDASTTNIIPAIANPGVCSRHLVGSNPDAYVLSLGDSFGSVTAVKFNGALLNKISYARPFESLMQTTWTPSDTTGNNGTVSSLNSSNEYRVETQTTRTITASSYSAGILTLTYSGPNLVPGQTIKVQSAGIYLIVSTFTTGTGTGTSQTGAQITAAYASNPGSLVADTIRSMCALPGTLTEWFDTTGTATKIWSWSLYAGIFCIYPAGQFPMNGPTTSMADWYDCKNMKIRVWHRCSSDPATQVKAVVFKYRKYDGSYSAGVTVSGLDNPADAGKVKILGEFSVSDVMEAAGGEGSYNVFEFGIFPTGTASDSQNRYFCTLQYEIVYTRPENGVRWMSTSEGSWSNAGSGQSYPGLKQMDPFTINSIAAAITQYNPGRQPIILIDQDIEAKTPANHLAFFEAMRTTWNAAFAACGGKSPKFLIWGYIFQEIQGGTLATNRGVVWDQNLGAYNFAKAHPYDVEFISMYQLSKGIFSPSFEQSVLPCGPNTCLDGNNYHFDDIRLTPTPTNVSDATWNNGTLTITKTNGFRDHPWNAGSNWFKTYVYLEPTSNTGTPVVAGWYQVASMTVSTIVLTASCTGGSAGVGADVRVVAFWTPMFTALHLSAQGASAMADWVGAALSTSMRAGTSALRIVGDRN